MKNPGRIRLGLMAAAMALLCVTFEAQAHTPPGWQPPPGGGGGGGGGGYTCVTDCKACATETTENGNSYTYCVDATNGSCGCVFSGDHAQDCGGTGSCTYE